MNKLELIQLIEDFPDDTEILINNEPITDWSRKISGHKIRQITLYNNSLKKGDEN